MMTVSPASPPINTFQDILNVLEQEPQLLQSMRGYILDQELRELPNTVAELVGAVKGLAAVTSANTERIDRLEAAVERLEATVAQLAADQAELKATVAQLAANQVDINDTLALLVTVARANAEHLQRVSGRVADIAGTRYQRFVARVVHRRLRRLLLIPDAAVIHTDWNPGPIIDEVAGSDNLSDAEVDDVSVIDFIAAGQDTAGNRAYAAGEISITAQPIDVVKAARRAAAVAKALDCTVHPVVVGQVILDETEAAAQEQGVTVITITPPPN